MLSRTTFLPVLQVAVLLACGSPGAAETNELLFESKAEETIGIRLRGDAEEDLRTVVERQKVNFHHVTLWGHAQDEPDRQVVVRETLRQVHDHGREGMESNLRVDLFFARENHGKFPTKPTHTLEIPDTHEAHFEDAFWTATTLGCCDSEPYSRMYSYDGKRPFLRYNDEFWKVEVPNARGLERYIGMAIRGHVPNAAAEEAIFANEKTAVVALSLAGPGKPLHTVYLVPRKGVNTDDLNLRTQKLEVRGTGPIDEQHPEVRLVTLWSLDGAKPENEDVASVDKLRVEAGIYVSDGTTETLQVEIHDDRFVNPRIRGEKLEAVLPD